MAPKRRAKRGRPKRGRPKRVVKEEEIENNVESICRLCLRNDNTLLCVFDKTMADMGMPGKIEKYLCLDIKKSDDISKSICAICVMRLDDVHNFFVEVEQNQQKIAELQAPFKIEKDSDVDDEETRPIINVQPYENNVEQEFLPSPIINNFLNATITENTTESPQYEMVSIKSLPSPSASKPQEDVMNDFENFDNMSIASSNDNDRLMEEDCNSGDEWHNSIDGFPKVLGQDAELVIRGRELLQLMSKFYKLQCDMCQEKDTVFVKLRSLLQHYKDTHSVKGYVKCCDTKLSRSRAMALHMARHVQPDAFKCPECGKMMTCPKLLPYHIQNHLPEEKRPLACSKCPRRYSYSPALAAHETTHLPEDERDSHVCDECGKSCKSANSLTTHISLAHSHDGPRHVCHECGKQFKNLKYHLTTHEQIHQVQCSVCQKWLKNKLILSRHMFQHSTVRHQCPSCDYSTVNVLRIENHLRVQHCTDKPHVCTVCGRSFKMKRTLRVHMVQHTGERKYACEYCPKRFASNGPYYSHRKRMHPDEWAEYKQKREYEKEKAREEALKFVRPEET